MNLYLVSNFEMSNLVKVIKLKLLLFFLSIVYVIVIKIAKIYISLNILSFLKHHINIKVF